MPANSVVSCSIFLWYLIFGNWPNLCPTVGAWQRERGIKNGGKDL